MLSISVHSNDPQLEGNRRWQFNIQSWIDSNLAKVHKSAPSSVVIAKWRFPKKNQRTIDLLTAKFGLMYNANMMEIRHDDFYHYKFNISGLIEFLQTRLFVPKFPICCGQKMKLVIRSSVIDGH
ncbi:hypothetical protein RF11_05949 [Thelohanellus kitauei]|uniref:Uncharacterized protein n=1 Tax=Thelohanellus kitauei TaxID=669202 RepID=A0A0C2J741_THEKT|nr:hypothetical protein RF11_05949 [Thelohanellus kitauei]